MNLLKSEKDILKAATQLLAVESAAPSGNVVSVGSLSDLRLRADEKPERRIRILSAGDKNGSNCAEICSISRAKIGTGSSGFSRKKG